MRIATDHGAHDHTFISAHHSDNAALEAACMADFVLIPCRPSILDLEAIANSLDIAKLAHKPASVILNAVAPSGSEADEAEEAITQFGANPAMTSFTPVHH